MPSPSLSVPSLHWVPQLLVLVVLVQPLLQVCVCVPPLHAVVVQLFDPGTHGVGPGSGPGPPPPSVQAWLSVLLLQPSEHVRVCVPLLQPLQLPHEELPRTQALMSTLAAWLRGATPASPAADRATAMAPVPASRGHQRIMRGEMVMPVRWQPNDGGVAR